MRRITRLVALLAGLSALSGAALAQSNPGFTAYNPGTPITATTGGVTGTLPAGPSVVASNTGANAAYCQLGTSATTSSQYIPSGAWFQFQIVNNQTQITCITATSTTVVNLVGGGGQAAGAGGGGSGGGGAVGNVNLTQVGSAAITLGQKTSANSVPVVLPSDQTVPVLATAGSSIIGKVGIDQTTPGTTNGVVVNSGTVTLSGTLTPTSRTSVSSSALAANLVVTNAAGSLFSFDVQADSTLSAAAWWIMVYNAASAPGDGAVTPIKCYALAPGTLGMSAAFPNPVAFSTGVVIGVSTTGCFTKTASTHAFISGDF